MPPDDNFFDQARPFTPSDQPWGEEPPPPGGPEDYGDPRVLEFPSGSRHKPPPRDALPLVWFRDIVPSLDCADFVQGLLIDNSAGIVYGPSNSGKTFFVTDLCLHVSGGIEWRGRRVEQGGVLYCAMEGGQGFRNRVAAWKEKHQVSHIDLPFVAIPCALNLRDSDADIEGLIAACKAAADEMALPVRLIVIDTVSRAMAGGNENAPEDMGAFVKAVDRIRQETGAMTLGIHHSGKDEARGARGHSLLQAAIDTEIEITKDEAGDGSTATVVKQRELRKGDTFPFSLTVVELGLNRHGEAVTTCIINPDVPDQTGTIPGRVQPLKGHPRRALEILIDLIARAGEAGFPGVPDNIPSVPEAWWKDSFFQRAMPGDKDDTKLKAFTRASSNLVTDHYVGYANKRVWLP